MRSARTTPPPNPPRPPRSRPPRPAGLALLAALALALAALTACSSGDVDDARRGAAADRSGTPGLAAVQATRVAQQFKPATPATTPDPATDSTQAPTANPDLPPTTLEALVVTLDLGPGNAPREQYASVPADAGTVFADALLHNLRAGQTVTAEWISANGASLGASQAEIPADMPQAWVALPLQLGGAVPPGDYAAFISVDGRSLNSIVFRVTSPGSGAQVLAPLPANPQVTEGGYEPGRDDPDGPPDAEDDAGDGEGDAPIEPIEGGQPGDLPPDGVVILPATETPP
jgi:hypothetical protein